MKTTLISIALIILALIGNSQDRNGAKPDAKSFKILESADSVTVSYKEGFPAVAIVEDKEGLRASVQVDVDTSIAFSTGLGGPTKKVFSLALGGANSSKTLWDLDLNGEWDLLTETKKSDAKQVGKQFILTTDRRRIEVSKLDMKLQTAADLDGAIWQFTAAGWAPASQEKK